MNVRTAALAAVLLSAPLPPLVAAAPTGLPPSHGSRHGHPGDQGAAPLGARPDPVPELTPPRPVTLGDNAWANGFGLPSTDGQVLCAVRFGDDLVVGGNFQQIGGVFANRIARWDGTSWHAMGGDFSREVTCLAVYQGAVFAGGPFQYVEGRFTQHLAKWDGTAWTPIGAVSSSYYCCYELNAMTVYRDELVVAGNFGDPRETPTRGVARWDGSTWEPFGAGVNGHVRAVLPVGDSLFVAGDFDSAGGEPAAGIACWDGDSWSSLGLGVSGTVRALAEFRGRIFAGGYFGSAGGEPIRGIAAWNGSTWSSLAGYEAFSVSALAVHEDTLIVASYPDILRWDGAAWVSSLGGILAEPEALISDGSDLIAVGDVVIISPDYQRVAGFELARWNGGVWTGYELWNERQKGLAMFAGYPAGIMSLVSFRGNLTAGGLIDYAGTGSSWQKVSEVSTWDGASWEGMPFTSAPASGIPAALLAEEDTLFAAGQFYRYTPFGSAFYPAMRWSGGQWTSLDTLSTTGTSLVRYDGQLVLGTWRYSSNDGLAAGVHVWDGTRWNAIGLTSGPDQFHGVRSLVVQGASLIAAGPFTSIGGVAANGIAAWDGNSWKSFGTPGPGYQYRPWVVDVGTYEGNLIAAGGFDDSGALVPLMSWDGESWKAIGGISGSASAMKVIGGRLFVSGYLSLEPAHERVNVAMWDGLEWDGLGSGTNGSANAILEHEGSVYFGGYFSAAGGKSSFGIARWDGLTPRSQSRALWLSQGRPNPFSSAANFSFTLERVSGIRVAIYDALGREIRTLQDGIEQAGSHSIAWDGKDGTGRRVPAGVYFISVEIRNGPGASRKVVRMR